MSSSILTIQDVTREGMHILEKTFLEIVIRNNLKTIERLMREGTVPNSDVLRVGINQDGTFDIYDFGFVGVSKRKLMNVPQKDVPQWIMETVSMLRITEESDLVPELGFKVNDCLYYVVDRTGESHE